MMKRLIFTLSSLLYLLTAFTQVQANTHQKPSNVDIITSQGYRLHTFHGASNSHIVETQNRLWIVDAQLTFKHAEKLRTYVQSLKKPVAAIVLSHNHPDHWFGAEKLADLGPIITTKAVKKDLDEGGERFLKILGKRLAGNMPTSVIKADDSLSLGPQKWDDLDVIIEQYEEQEAHHSVAIKIPKLKVIIGQDLFYNNNFLVASEQTRNQHWKALLQQFLKNDSKDYDTLLVGHGNNGGFEIIEQNIHYLDTLTSVLALKLSKEETTKKMLELFPNMAGKNMLNISMNNLFNPNHK